MSIPWIAILAIGSVGSLIVGIYKGWYLPRKDRKRERIINFYKPLSELHNEWIATVKRYGELRLDKWEELREQSTDIKSLETYEKRINQYQNQLKSTQEFIKRSIWYIVFFEAYNHLENLEELGEIVDLRNRLVDILMHPILRDEEITHSLLRDEAPSKVYKRITDQPSIRIDRILRKIDKMRNGIILKEMRERRSDFLKFLKDAKEEVDNRIEAV